jgi:hypothetical protein
LCARTRRAGDLGTQKHSDITEYQSNHSMTEQRSYRKRRTFLGRPPRRNHHVSCLAFCQRGDPLFCNSDDLVNGEQRKRIVHRGKTMMALESLAVTLAYGRVRAKVFKPLSTVTDRERDLISDQTLGAVILSALKTWHMTATPQGRVLSYIHTYINSGSTISMIVTDKKSGMEKGVVE